MAPSTRRLLAGFLLLPAIPLAQAEPATGIWSEQTELMSSGMVIQQIKAETCYAQGKAGVQAHVDRLAQRLIDPSCTSEAESKLDATRYALRCGGAAFGDGLVTVAAEDDRSMRVDIVFRNNATGLDMEYITDTSWKGPDCHARG